MAGVDAESTDLTENIRALREAKARGVDIYGDVPPASRQPTRRQRERMIINRDPGDETEVALEPAASDASVSPPESTVPEESPDSADTENEDAPSASAFGGAPGDDIDLYVSQRIEPVATLSGETPKWDDTARFNHLCSLLADIHAELIEIGVKLEQKSRRRWFR